MMLGNEATEEEVQALREELGLNDPFVVRYFRFLGNAVRGDFGKSYMNNRPVADEILQRFKYTLIIQC